MLCKSNDQAAINLNRRKNVIFSRIKNMIMRRKNKNCWKKSHVQESHYDPKDQFYLKEFMTTVTKTADVGMHVNSTCIWETPT